MEVGAIDVDALVGLGLTGYEAQAYVALTRRARATGAEAARLAGVPRQRIYDVLEGLVARGLASVEPGRPARYAAVPPEEAVGSLLAEHRSRLDRLERETADTIARLSAAFVAGRDESDPLGYIEVLREPAATASRFTELEAAAEREILAFTKPPYAVEPAENVAGLESLGRKIVARSVYERSVYADEARVVDELPLKLVLIDERVALFTMDDPVAGGSPLTIMVVEHAGLAGLLKLAFESVWARAEPFA